MRRVLSVAIVGVPPWPWWRPISADTNITDRPYVRHDGGTDVTITTCNSDAPANPNAGERQQNEPTAAVNPLNVHEDDRGRERLLPRAHDDRRLGGHVLLVRRRRELGQQPRARLPDRHFGGRPGVAALRLHHQRRRSRAGLGPDEPPLLRRDRVQPRQADERLDLGRALQLGPAVRRAGPRVHDDRVPRDADELRSRALRGQGRARGGRRARTARSRATSTSAGPASPARARTTSSSSRARPTAAAPGTRRRSPSRSTATRSATSP